MSEGKKKPEDIKIKAKPLIYEPQVNFDVLAYSLSDTQSDIVMTLLLNQKPLSTKAIERSVSYARIIRYCGSKFSESLAIISAKHDRAEKKPDKRATSPHFDMTPAPLERFVPSVEQDKDLRTIAEAYFRVSLNDTTERRRFIGLLKPERNRIMYLTRINKLYHYSIPSYKKIESELKRLFISNIVKPYRYEGSAVRLNADQIWALNPEFYREWSKRHDAIIEEREKKRSDMLKELRMTRRGLKDSDLHRTLPSLSPDYPERMEKDAKRETDLYLGSKYGMKVLDFYLIPLFHPHDYHDLLTSIPDILV